METNEERDRQERKRRADAIRQARDARNADIARKPSTDAEEAIPEAPEDGSQAEPGAKREDRTPNYVDLIDRRMRELDRDTSPDKP